MRYSVSVSIGFVLLFYLIPPNPEKYPYFWRVEMASFLTSAYQKLVYALNP